MCKASTLKIENYLKKLNNKMYAELHNIYELTDSIQ